MFFDFLFTDSSTTRTQYNWIPIQHPNFIQLYNSLIIYYTLHTKSRRSKLNIYLNSTQTCALFFVRPRQNQITGVGLGWCRSRSTDYMCLSIRPSGCLCVCVSVSLCGFCGLYSPEAANRTIIRWDNRMQKPVCLITLGLNGFDLTMIKGPPQILIRYDILRTA